MKGNNFGGSSVKVFAKLSIIVCCLLISGIVYAQTCNITTTSINFGPYDVFLSTSTDSTGTLSVTCGSPPPPHVTITIGSSPNSGGFIPRKLKSVSGTNFLNYNLFTDASMTSVWGDGTSGTSTVPKVVTPGRPVIATVYGRIPAKQDVSSGTYSETLTVTVIW
jgi:spore coat protein U-like protein